MQSSPHVPLIVIRNLTGGGRPYGLIENVVTHAAYRGRGFGKQILYAAVAAAWRADCYKVMLMTGSKEPSTLAFYTAVGFEQSKAGFQVRRLPSQAAWLTDMEDPRHAEPTASRVLPRLVLPMCCP
jgi:ribosomal protein S18 acetylase RimI-like enzyme